MFVLSRIIKEAFDKDEFVLAIVAGPLRWGKSVYSMKVMAELYGIGGIPDYRIKTIKEYLKWHPTDVIDKWMGVEDKELVFTWDDAGYWLHALTWNHPWSKAVQKYFNVIGTDWGGVILTTPQHSWVIKKIREMENMVVIEINKFQESPDWRRAVAYDCADYLLGRRNAPLFVDDFKIRLNETLYKWYYPLRKKYAQLAKKLVKAELSTLREVELALV